ncbi:hypothetical protein AHFPHNDE_01921 [Pseudomonas sp. MM227]|jgi:ElaB/YqjD/DUF883 family membrane-anchored ribosome-binding protein|uniref:DUF883 family protein n=1 Tax=Pseudomonas baltica TaxID=2762576 RepID=A0A7X1KSJ0_9PSED|nr:MULTISPECIES: DUF883 family protein [Pseudomonas]MBC2677430.1 DUF883 family protein [Pseudomonas baltica]MBD8472680.1 DUF883 family protein [Pseudomonas sp. CFBP 8773]MBD8595535.1 DUF883 family protein [Pseudomonas sp. CFBP 8758]MBD8601663.1 DUF883 family protein [Pseudomonas sp. CFBP 8771]MBD8621509.1 DUF883 family protein [Pseudomonas sp. CFBP 13727]
MARRSSAESAEDQIKDQVFSELLALIEESEKMLRDGASLVGDDANSLRAQVNSKLEHVSYSLAGLRERAKPVVEATQTYIGGHPWQTVAASATCGLLLGLLLGRRD